MSSNGQSFASNNPFRRKLNTSSNPAGTSNQSLGTDQPVSSPTTAPPITTLRSSVPENEGRHEEQPVQQIPRKIVKKVRVQSPPPSPSSPEDAVPVTHRSRHYDSDSDSNDSSRSHEPSDPFNTDAVNIDNDSPIENPLTRIPPNPFARTLQDIEGKGQAYEAQTTTTGSSKGSLDVNSFKRLLLTGHADLPDTSRTLSPVDGSSVSRQSANSISQGTLGASRESSGSESPDEHKNIHPPSHLVAVPATSTRQKPPPPSSRYGKLIKMELGADSDSGGAKSTLHPLLEATNTNKPLPAPPLRSSIDEDIESPFDREAAGKVPEPFAELQSNPRSPTPPPTTRSRSESQTSTQSQKPAAPPPRRQGRFDGKVPSIQPYAPHTDEDAPRSSMESSRSQTEALRIGIFSDKSTHAPAPPPPRRPGHMRQASSVTSNNHPGLSPTISPGPSEKERAFFGSGFTQVAQPGHTNSGSTATSISNGSAKSRPPPPPPTRKQSVRLPRSIRGMEGSNGPAAVRRVSREKDGMPPPPPPPPRSRGSRLYSDSPAEEARRDSASTVSTTSTENESATSTVLESGTQGQEILADLDALQREVDEFMKKSAGS
ncbi:hypothetical protein GGS21DRAFT_162820 [Xylaria nigripes]|nr:hypothetical protein GGS21DRAFT_162820 [Xylaria nigripes]